MFVLYRIIFKLFSLLENLKNRINLKICISKGMKVGKNFNMPGKVNFGTEPFLIEIGDDVNIAEGVSFINHGGTTLVVRNISGYEDARVFGRIKIGNNVTIGLNCVILQDVSIGHNCVLAANSVLSQSMPNNAVFAGNPARYVCSIEEYGDTILKNNAEYPRELEKNKKLLNEYLAKNLPHYYKPTR